MDDGFRHIEVHPALGGLGAEIAAVDLSQPLPDGVIGELHDCFHRHQVIVLRAQRITPQQQIGFARPFGELTCHPLIPGLDGYPQIMEVRKEPEDAHTCR